tara:strand:- start:5 stop:1735 length:1731 start_codon:yes stop_codon:yes gene_type:complete
MSWHEEFLSENNKKKTLSTMGDLFKLIEEVYEVEKGTLFKEAKDELQVLKEQFLNERKELSLTLQAIPEVSVSELGWTDVRTTGGQKVSGPERNQLGQFLSQIQGSNLSEKVESLSRFYQEGPSEDMSNMSVGKKIANTLSYLVFFKALTKVVSNFNAASAGFNFEAFLAVLLDGKQVPANTGTIADFTTGDEIPISLKLYNEKSVVVGGSFNDLVGDLVNPQFSGFPGMRYVVCMKSFTSSETGEKQGSGLDIEGDIKFFQFDFTLDNVADIIARSMDKSKICMQLPREFIRSNGETDVSANLPGANMPSPQELEDRFLSNFYKIAKVGLRKMKVPVDESVFGEFLDALEWSKRDSLFGKVKKGESALVVRGESGIAGKTRNKEVLEIAKLMAEEGKIPLNNEEGQPLMQPFALAKEIRKFVVLATDDVNEEFTSSRVKSDRNKVLKRSDFYAALSTSVKFYNNITDPEMKKRALLNSRGMLETYQFDVNRKQVLEISENLGTIKIGARIVQEMLNKMTVELNESIFEIFTNVKAVQDNTYAFMAGGLQDDEKAKASIKASNAIAYKTEELRDTE